MLITTKHHWRVLIINNQIMLKFSFVSQEREANKKWKTMHHDQDGFDEIK